VVVALYKYQIQKLSLMFLFVLSGFGFSHIFVGGLLMVSLLLLLKYIRLKDFYSVKIFKSSSPFYEYLQNSSPCAHAVRY
jgi:hypothetical protein